MSTSSAREETETAVDNLQHPASVTSRRHADKDIRKALKLAQRTSWTFEEGKGHRFATLRCGAGCEVAVWSTPRNPSTHAKRIREALERCPHDPTTRTIRTS
jgi:hypothetical protein